MPRLTHTVVALLAALLVPSGVAAFSGRQLALADLAHDAGSIVHGTVVELTVGRDEHHLPSTWVTLAIHCAVKGPRGTRVTFKQLGTSRPLPDGVVLLTDLPRYALGDEVVLFLYPTSDYGFTSPLGAGQGYFRVEGAGSRARVRAPDGASRPAHGLMDAAERMGTAP